ncbi:uncharacterized protein LOC111358023 [Spodoptera litura]|uniref:Uncharacterized protein LOC111358023 n=1 Tax=Spodoptera litura TaxID=69820 RepID=A0A9J7IWZ4_SPOLT|nr:uncharacterized protein LOC111358023 [Spodoptera litura]
MDNKMEIDLKGKVAIVTGASSGIGAATAIAFAKHGAKLSLVGRDEVRLLQTVNKCVEVSNEVPLWVRLDLTQPGACEAVVNKTVETYGKLDILVNSAGKVVLSDLTDESMEKLDDLMNLNFRVPYRLTQLSLRHLEKTKGNIVNIGSSMSKRGLPGTLGYTLSKEALQTFSRQAVLELAPLGVRINCITPGPSRTNIRAPLIVNNPHLLADLSAAYAQYLDNGMILDPNEIATLICWTASDMFPNLNGADMLLDGAHCMAFST